MPAIEKSGEEWTTSQPQYPEDCIFPACLSREFGAGRGQVTAILEGGHNYGPDDELAPRIGIYHSVFDGPTTAKENNMATLYH